MYSKLIDASNMIGVMVLLFTSFLFFFSKELAITSDEALSLEEFPKHAVVLGGGCVLIYLFVF